MVAVTPLALEIDGLGGAGELLEAPRAEGLYLLHLSPPYLHAEHYLGYARDIRRRVEQHRSGGTKASPLIAAAIDQGSQVLLARVILGGDRQMERRMKNGGGLSRHCPICRAGGRWHR